MKEEKTFDERAIEDQVCRAAEETISIFKPAAAISPRKGRKGGRINIKTK